MTAFAARCDHIADRLIHRALAVAVVATLLLAATIAVSTVLAGPRPLLAGILALLALACAMASLALSALLVFDAALFRLMASHADETSAGRAVDDFLARARLKPLPETTRPLDARIAGAERLMRRHLAAAAATALLAVLALAANFA